MTYEEWKIIFKKACDICCEEYEDEEWMSIQFERGRTPKQALDVMINERCGIEE